MINRTKIASLAVCAILSAAVLTGCGGSSASSSTASSAAPAASSQAASSVVSSAAAEENGASDLDGIYNALLQADPISNQFEIAAMNIEYDFNLPAEDVVSYKGVKSNDNGDAGMVLVVEAADGKAEEVANQLTAYQQDQVAFYGNYAEFAQAQENVENAVIAFKDNTVVMVIASNECTADLDSAVETLLAADPISNQFEIAAMNIEYDFGLKADDVTSYKGIKSNDNGDAGLVLAIQPAAGKAQDVMDTLKTYQQDQVAFYGNYAEFAQAQSNVENAIISSKGDRVVMVIASNECTADLNSAVNSALNS